MVEAGPRSVGPTPPESEPAMNRRIPVLATALIGALALLPVGNAAASGGSGGGSGGGGGGGGGTKTGCTNSVAVTATASESLSGNSFSATPILNSCQGKTKVSLTATDLSNGQLVMSVPDVSTASVFWTLPYKLTSYRIDARAFAPIGGILSTVATGSTTVDTLTPLSCTPDVSELTRVGYWTTWAAIWASHSATDCGLGGTVEVRITNMTTGQVELDLPTSPLSTTYDYEGAQVAYNTPYHIESLLLSSTGELLDSASEDIVTPSKP